MLTELVNSGITSIYDITEEQYDKISNLNMHENFDSNANRFMTDLLFSKKYSK
jgi:hypothetical protein